MSAGEVKLRAAQEKDTSVVLQLVKGLAEYEKSPESVTATVGLLKKNLFGEKKYAEAVLAEIDGEVVGFALFFHTFSTWVGKPGIYIDDLYVKPEFRHRGIGKMFFKHLIQLAKERDCGRIEWIVLDWNEPAIRFYKKIGGKEQSEWKIYRLTEDQFETIKLD